MKRAFAKWWATTAADRFTRIGAKVLDHRKFWDAMHAVDADMLQEITARLTAAMIEQFELVLSSVALDRTNFATYLDTTNTKAPARLPRQPPRRHPVPHPHRPPRRPVHPPHQHQQCWFWCRCRR